MCSLPKWETALIWLVAGVLGMNQQKTPREYLSPVSLCISEAQVNNIKKKKTGLILIYQKACKREIK